MCVYVAGTHATTRCIRTATAPPQLAHLVASLVGLHDDGGGVVVLHLGALDHLVGHVHVLGVVLVVVDLRNRHVGARSLAYAF